MAIEKMSLMISLKYPRNSKNFLSILKEFKKEFKREIRAEVFRI